MNAWRQTLITLLLATTACASGASESINGDAGTVEAPPVAGLQHLTGHIRADFANAPVTGRLSGDVPLTLVFHLPVRDMRALRKTLRDVSDPKSPLFRHYLTGEQFAERFGAPAADYDAVEAWASVHHLEVQRHKNRLAMNVGGRVTDLEEALHLRMNYAARPDGTTFRAPDREPSIDLNVRVERIGNLDNFKRPVASASYAPNGSGPGNDFTGNQVRAAYIPFNLTSSGAGQSVAVVDQFNGCMIPSDFAYYVATLNGCFGVSPCTFEGINYNNAQPVPAPSICYPGGGPLSANTEETEDVEGVLTIAPSAQVTVFGGLYPKNYGSDGIYEAIVDSVAASGTGPIPTVTSSYNDGYAVAPEHEPVFDQMAIQGQTFLNSSGDIGLYDSRVDSDIDLQPTEDFEQATTLVGATELSLNGSGGYGEEWPWVTSSQATSGGVMTAVAIPWYQFGAALVSNQYGSTASTVYRNFPDISLLGTSMEGWVNGASHGLGGTSLAAPLLAGIIALANAENLASGKAYVGFLNPVLYGLASTEYYNGSFFHDITATIDGNCGFAACPSAGYDLATGLGTPGPYFVNYLADSAWTWNVQNISGIPGTVTSFALTKGTPSSYIAWAINNVSWSGSSPDHQIWYLTSSGWKQAQGGALEVTVNPATGYPWIVNSGGTAFYSSNGGAGWSAVTTGAPSGGFIALAGAPTYGSWGAAGATGGQVVWAISTYPYTVWVYNNAARPNEWLDWGQPTSVITHIAVAPDTGQPWLTDFGGNVWASVVASPYSVWEKVTDVQDAGTTAGFPGGAIALGVGPRNQVWVVNTQPWEFGSHDDQIFMLTEFTTITDAAWSQQPGGANFVGSAADGTPWLINYAGTVFVGTVGWGQYLGGSIEELGADAGWPGWRF